MVMKFPLALLPLLVLPFARVAAGAPARLYPLTVLSDNPSAYWRLDESNGNVAHDQAGGHDCLLTNVQLNATGYTASDADTAATFGILTTSNSYAGELDKSSNGIANLNFAQPLGSNAEFSVEAWVKGDPQAVNAGIVAKGYGNGGEQFNLDTGSTNVATHGFRFSVHDAGGTNHNASSTVTPDGQWHHLVGVCDEPQGWVRLYIDGVDSAHVAVPSGAGMLTTSNGAAPGTTLVSIGSRTSSQAATSFNNQFIGVIDEVAVYGYALTAAQVMAHYQAGFAAPRITNAVLRGTNFILSGASGLSNGVCALVASTNLALVLTNWTSVATNPCDASGRVTFTNPVAASAPRQFFALQSAPASAELWIPPVGAWLGAEVTNGINRVAYSNHEANIGRQLDILRGYHTLSNWTNLNSVELSYLNAGQKLFLSVKPDPNWSNAVGVANGGSATVDAELGSLAQSIGAIKPLKLMLCVWHEPENDVVGTSGGTAGTTNQYVAMWHNVRSIFNAYGATNVIWCWVIINAPFYRDLLPGLWPGNSYVDWVGWDVYQATNNEDYVAKQLSAYTYLVNSSDTNHTYTAKPWAWTEWGVGNQTWVPTVADQTNTFNAVSTALNARLFPRIRYAAYFDTRGPNGTASAILPGAWGAYSNLANSPYLIQSGAH
jgi:hypothetical protein